MKTSNKPTSLPPEEVRMAFKSVEVANACAEFMLPSHGEGLHMERGQNVYILVYYRSALTSVLPWLE